MTIKDQVAGKHSNSQLLLDIDRLGSRTDLNSGLLRLLRPIIYGIQKNFKIRLWTAMEHSIIDSQGKEIFCRWQIMSQKR